MQEADAVFNSQQVRRTNVNPNTLKAYDIYREHWLVSVFLVILEFAAMTLSWSLPDVVCAVFLSPSKKRNALAFVEK
jgi:hypothetical protein